MNSIYSKEFPARQASTVPKIVELFRQPWIPRAPVCIIDPKRSPRDKSGVIDDQNLILVKVDEESFDLLVQYPGRMRVELHETIFGESACVLSLGDGVVLLPAEEIATCFWGPEICESIIGFVSETRYASVRYQCDEPIRQMLSAGITEARCDERRKKGTSIEEIVLRDSYVNGIVGGIFAIDLGNLDDAARPLHRVFSNTFQEFSKSSLVSSVVGVLREFRSSGIELTSLVVASAMEVVYDAHFSTQPFKQVSRHFWRYIRFEDVLDVLEAFDSEYARVPALRDELGNFKAEIAAFLVKNYFAERCVELLPSYPKSKALWAAGADEVLAVVLPAISGQPDEQLLRQAIGQYGAGIVGRATEMQRRLALMDACNESDQLGFQPKSFANWCL
ncbi:hypothetical protein B0G81_2225 [Paraburkholderia sp. BL6665CI2N2]|uniref:hypothetical protein n=1 Tax=Paraburkholderia sp. BL6665CI2N2 TaxID=1938806 RepID=UPI001065E3A0|nr:hypothetical protein [Paraburkholderia sp. BL6665CI2N2]TDY21978.1 hypothetical protein B0G81_2225 [Paraburkholderia sp. BL6665CI2N2]